MRSSSSTTTRALLRSKERELLSTTTPARSAPCWPCSPTWLYPARFFSLTSMNTSRPLQAPRLDPRLRQRLEHVGADHRYASVAPTSRSTEIDPQTGAITTLDIVSGE